MKTFVLSIVIMAVTIPACSDNNSNTKDSSKSINDSTTTSHTGSTSSNQLVSADEAVTAYLKLKNALTADDGKEAAAAGKQLNDAIQKLENAPFSEDQKKVFDDVKDDMKDHAEHISTNADKIAHQREHFEILSKDMVDLVKVVKPSQTLYRDYCPMYNNKKGADWLSEVKEIKNPYYGKEMLKCGEVKEEIK